MRQDNYMMNRLETAQSKSTIVQVLSMLPILYIGLSLISIFGD